MKKILILFLSTIYIFSSCADFLSEKNETDPTVDFIYGTPDGLNLAVTGLYPLQRQMARLGDNGGEGSLHTLFLHGGDDITFVRAGSGDWSGAAWYDRTKLTPLSKDVESFWAHNYQIIGKANEIIYYAFQMDTANALVKQALGEAYCFRAQSYFNLLRRFDNIYFTTDIVTPYNLNDKRDYSVAQQEKVITEIKNDLDYAIRNLDWQTKQRGRYTQGAARHMKALVDMHPIHEDLSTMDLNDAIFQVETILSRNGLYDLMENPKDVFTPSTVSATQAKLNNKELILVEQWSDGVGGAPTNAQETPSGHRLAASFLARYDQGLGGNTVADLEQGGTSWGRIYPNDYLLSLYNKQKDKRYKDYYKHFWQFNNIGKGKTLTRKLIVSEADLEWLGQEDLGFEVPSNVTAGMTINFVFKDGDTIPKFMTSNFAMYLHPSSNKFFDKWTRTATTNPSFKDIVIYRLAETCLIGAEAYLRKGDQVNAKRLFNKTWMRAGNDEWKLNLSLQDILDEDAREFACENYGHRWYLLKRFGADVMERQITTYSGSTNPLNKFAYNATSGKTSQPTGNLTNYGNYFSVRNNFKNGKVGGKLIYIRWPIPQSQINSMGGKYPQNLGYAQ